MFHDDFVEVCETLIPFGEEIDHAQFQRAGERNEERKLVNG
jgi:hypothetical protein